jgi:hypothetical protein
MNADTVQPNKQKQVNIPDTNEIEKVKIDNNINSV